MRTIIRRRTAEHKEAEQNYLTFVMTSSGSFNFGKVGNVTKNISYSVNGAQWVEVECGSTGSTILGLHAGDKIRAKGTNASYGTDVDNYIKITGLGETTCDIYGNIMSLVYGDNFKDKTSFTENGVFWLLFYQSTVGSAENLILPATTLTEDCYRAMFSSSTLAVPPQILPATTLGARCYKYMFNATSITASPYLPDATTATDCYDNMFTNAASLASVTCLQSTTFTEAENWLSGCPNTSDCTFTKAAGASWGRNASGIPDQWTVIEAA